MNTNGAKVNAGALRHRLVIQVEQPVSDGGGGQGADPWANPVTLATLWGAVEPLRGSERLRAMQIQDSLTHRVTLRYRAGITTSMRVVFGTRVFNIRAVINVGERNRVLELLCEEGVAV